MPTSFASIGIPVLAFCFVCTISTFFVDGIIRRLHDQLPKILGKDEEETESLQRNTNCTKESLILDFGQLIGRFERPLYIYSAMIGDYQLTAGWLVVKAFFGWVTKSRNPDSCLTEAQQDMFAYYTYVFGTLLSLLIGILLGNVGALCSDGALSLLGHPAFGG